MRKKTANTSLTFENMNEFCRTCLAPLNENHKYHIHTEEELSKWLGECTTVSAKPQDKLPKFVCQQCHDSLRAFYEFRCTTERSLGVLMDLLKQSPVKRRPRKTRKSEEPVESILEKVNQESNQDWLQFEDVNVWREKQEDGNSEELSTKVEQLDDKSSVMDTLLEPEVPIIVPVTHIDTMKVELDPDDEFLPETDTSVGILLPTDDLKVDVIDFNDDLESHLPQSAPPSASDRDALAIALNTATSPLTLKNGPLENDDDHVLTNTSDSELSLVSIYSPQPKKRKPRKAKTQMTKNPTKSKSNKSKSSAPVEPKKAFAPYQCDRCPRRFVSEENRAAHMRTHDGLKPYECKECNHSFNRAYHYRTHMREVHAPDRQDITCTFPDCGKTFARESTYKLHVRIKHSGKPPDRERKTFVCEQCGCTFSNVTKFKEHRYKHMGVEAYPYKCEECGKRFNKSRTFKEHKMRHAGIKNFVCPYCGMKKTTRAELRTHINYHTKEKQWPCKFCPMVFNSSANWGMHDRIVHKGIKRYACRYCDQSFAKSDTWKHHEMRHTGEKPHGCEICGKRFIQLVALRAHLKTHNKFENKQTRAAQAVAESNRSQRQEGISKEIVNDVELATQ